MQQDTEGSKLPPEVQFDHLFLKTASMYCLQLNLLLKWIPWYSYFSTFSNDGNSVRLNPGQPKIHNNHLCIVQVQDEQIKDAANLVRPQLFSLKQVVCDSSDCGCIKLCLLEFLS